MLKTAAVRRDHTGRIILHSAGSGEDSDEEADGSGGGEAESKPAGRRQRVITWTALFSFQVCFKVEVDAASLSILRKKKKKKHIEDKHEDIPGSAQFLRKKPGSSILRRSTLSEFFFKVVFTSGKSSRGVFTPTMFGSD